MIKELEEGVLRCTPKSMVLMVKITLDGRTGVISGAEGGYKPRTSKVRPYPLSGQPRQCLRDAMVGKPAIYFRSERPFTVSYPFAHSR